jgi:hypothetical protein
MTNRNFLWVLISMALICGMMVIGCEPEPEPEVYDTIYSVSIQPTSVTLKVGSALIASAKNIDGFSASGVSYQWKRADSQNGTFVNISNATSQSYTPVNGDIGKYIKVEARNSDTPSPVQSTAVGPINGNQAAKPTAYPAGGEVVQGQEITLTSANSTIRYTLDGTTPTSSSTLYSSSSKPKITSSCTLKAIATGFDLDNSEVLSVSYTVIPAPAFSSVTSTGTLLSNGIYSAAYGNNRFVAGGDNAIAYSTNGTTWTASTGNSNFTVRGITYGTQFVAVGSGGTISTSSDGTSWTNVTTSTFGSSEIRDVVYNDGKYVAVGASGKIACSDVTGPSTWTAVTNSTFETSAIYGITYGAGKYVAVGAGGKMAYSTNGTTWTAVAASTFNTQSIFGITYGGPPGNEKFIAVGGSILSSTIAYSTDGITWTQSLFVAAGSEFKRVTWGGNKYVAVTYEGVMYFSLDGTNWAKIEGGTGAGKSQFDTNLLSSINDIVYGGGKFLAVGSKYVSSNNYTGEMAISN